MPGSLLSRLSSRLTRSKRETPRSHITDGPDLPKTEIGPAREVLKDELLRLYWNGVTRDLPHIISSLRKSLAADLVEEETSVVHDGYDVSKQRARLLLQSAQWLDIDKLIEHRDPPPAKLGTGLSKTVPPSFERKQCHDCNATLPGPQCIKVQLGDEDRTARTIVCETCYHSHHYGEEASPYSDKSDYPYAELTSDPRVPSHMALRIGPLVMEIGVEHINGVLITTRKAPGFQADNIEAPESEALIIEDLDERTLFTQKRPHHVRQYKGIVKQVVGGSFCGFIDKYNEDFLIESLVALAKGTVSACKEGSVDFEIFWDNLKSYLEPNAKFYISTMAYRLSGPLEIQWNAHHNNCQTFCSNLIADEVFARLVSRPPPTNAIISGSNPEKPYLLSFVNTS